jgi:hypothetical protein
VCSSDLPDDDKSWVAISLCRDIILYVADSHVEELGLVELLKDDLKDFFTYCREEEKKETNKEDKKAKK